MIKSSNKRIAHYLIFDYKKLNKLVYLRSFANLKNGFAFRSDSYKKSGRYKIITIVNVTGNKNVDITSCNKVDDVPKEIQNHQVLKKIIFLFH